MLTRRREDSVDNNHGSPKRIRVAEVEHDTQCSTRFSSLAASHAPTTQAPLSSNGVDSDAPDFLCTSSRLFTSIIDGDSENGDLSLLSLSPSHSPLEGKRMIVNEFGLRANVECAVVESTESATSSELLNEPLEASSSTPVQDDLKELKDMTTVCRTCKFEEVATGGSEDGDCNKKGVGKNHAHGISAEDSSEDDQDQQYTVVGDKVESSSMTTEVYEHYRREAREKGTGKFIQEYFFDRQESLSQLFSAFDSKLPLKIAGVSDIQLLPILDKVVTKFLRHREKLSDINTLDDVLRLLRESKNIMVLTGAGISVSCGIPDFRSENGIYSRLSEFDLDDPQDMFDINYFREYPEVFYSFAKEIFPSNFKPSPSHYFVKLLEDRGKLMRNYTQNIDTLEQAAGIKKVLQCHGSFATATCMACGYRVSGEQIKDAVLTKRVPYCSRCRCATTETDDEDESGAVMKPDIVFFGEKLPSEFDHYFPLDREKVDLLIVMGSSLKVAPVSEIMGQIPHRVPQIVINRTPITHMQFDVQLLGDCDAIVAELCRLLEWDLAHEKIPGGSSKDKPPTAHEFVPPCYYLFEGFEGALPRTDDIKSRFLRPTANSDAPSFLCAMNRSHGDHTDRQAILNRPFNDTSDN